MLKPKFLSEPPDHLKSLTGGAEATLQETASSLNRAPPLHPYYLVFK